MPAIDEHDRSLVVALRESGPSRTSSAMPEKGRLRQVLAGVGFFLVIVGLGALYAVAWTIISGRTGG